MVGEKKTTSSFLKSRFFIGIAFIATLLLVAAFGRAYYRNYQIRQEIKQLQAEADRLQAKKVETLELLQYVQSKNFVEEKARTELHLLKEGEKVAVITNRVTEKEIQKEPLSKTDVVTTLSNPKKWWYYFFGD